MKAAPFEYVRAASVEEACALLGARGDGARLIAGGQSLVPLMAMRLARPSLLIDINEIVALKYVSATDDRVRIGAGTRQCVAERDDALAARVPLIRLALAWVGHAQTRHRGTIGGSLAHADPAAELPLVAQVLGASMRLRRGKGARVVSAEQFFRGAMATAVRPEECVEEIEWPAWPERRAGAAFDEVSIRHGDFAIAAAAAQVAVDADGRCVRAVFGLGGVGETPIAFPHLAAHLIGGRLEDEAIRAAAADAAMSLAPGSDLQATASYRRHLAGVLAARVLRAAREEACRK